MREIVTDTYLKNYKARAGEPAPTRDEYLDKVLKLIPGEVVALYIFLTGVLGGAGLLKADNPWLWFVFIVCFFGVPYQLIVLQKVGNYLQVGISTAAYIVWVLAIGGPFALYYPGAYNSAIGAVVLAIFTFILPPAVK